MDETQRIKERDEEWRKYYAERIRKDSVNVGKNRKRADTLVAYAAPYRLNVITDESKYTLSMEHPNTGYRLEHNLTRELVDRSPDPEAVVKGYIDAMRRDMENKYPAGTAIIDSATIGELVAYAAPFALELDAAAQPGRVSIAIELTLRKVPEYGFKADVVYVPMGDKNEILRKCRTSIDKMRTELGWKREEDGMPIQPVQGAKPFVLECPDHGGQMVPAEEDVFVCLVPGCKKRARRKRKTFEEQLHDGLPAPARSTVTIGDTTLPAGTEFRAGRDHDSGLWDIDPQSLQNVKEAFQDAHGHVWQRKD